MAFAPSSPVTGATQTGLTSPTYTLTSMAAPSQNGKQYYVSALGGTQVGVAIHSASSPFTINFVTPSSLKSLGAINPATGQLRSVPRNTYKLITRKGVIPLSGQATVPMLITTTFEIPAGSDLVDPEDIRAALSLHIGTLNQVSAATGDTLIAGA